MRLANYRIIFLHRPAKDGTARIISFHHHPRFPMPLPTHVLNEIARLMRDPDALRHEGGRMSLSGRRGPYNPNQPRVPAGNSDGGQWTHTGRGAGAGTYERPRIDQPLFTGMSLADALVGRLPIEHVQAKPNQRRFPNPLELIDIARLSLYNELSARNNSNQQAVVEFRAAQYGRRTVGIERIGILTRAEVIGLCDRFADIQMLTDDAVAGVRNSGTNLSPQQFGTAVHLKVKKEIDGMKDDYLKAELSFLKGFEDDYGVKGTIRIDGLGRVRKRPDTACIYDIKTGRSGLTFPRMLEMVVNTQKAFNGEIRHFIVTEVRPSQ
jgi:hypothetical protein